MASTPRTDGFQVNVMPGYQLANPSYFNPYAALAQGVQSGVSMGGQLQDIALRREAADAEAQMRPVRQQMLQAQLAGQLQQQGFAADDHPLRQQLLQAEIQKATQQQQLADILQPGKIAEAKQPSKTLQSTFQDTDEFGNLNEYGSYRYIDPQTQEVSYTPRVQIRTVKTKEQLQQEKLNAEALRTQRIGTGQAAATRAATAAQVAQFKQENPTVKTRTFYDGAMNVFEQVINPDGSLGDIAQIILPDGSPAKRPQTAIEGVGAQLGKLFAPPATGAAATAGAANEPPPAAVQYLLANPASAAIFDQKYGAGASARFLKRG